MLLLLPPALIVGGALVIRCLARHAGWKTRSEVLHGLRENFERRASKFRILVGFTQVVSRITVTFRLTFPPIVAEWLRWLNVFEFLNVFHFAFIPNCLYSLDYYDQLLCEVLGPAFVLVVALVGFEVTKQRWMYELFLLLSFVCYPAFCDSLFLFFDCKLYEDGETYLGEQLLLIRLTLVD